MIREDTFDLGAIDVFAAGDKHILLAVDNGENSFAIHNGDIARRQPSPLQLFCSRFGIAQIFCHQSRLLTHSSSFDAPRVRSIPIPFA